MDAKGQKSTLVMKNLSQCFDVLLILQFHVQPRCENLWITWETYAYDWINTGIKKYDDAARACNKSSALRHKPKSLVGLLEEKSEIKHMKWYLYDTVERIVVNCNWHRIVLDCDCTIIRNLSNTSYANWYMISVLKKYRRDNAAPSRMHRLHRRERIRCLQ